jgi:hypothetical protein
MEEYHFSLNICRYDRRYLSLKFHVRPENIFGFETIIQGSNENRPKVLVGDCIRLRPIAEDCHLKLSDWLSDIWQVPFDCTNLTVQLAMFEINAIVSYYDLRTEKVLASALHISPTILYPYLISASLSHCQVTCKCSFPTLDVLIEKIYQHNSIEVVYTLRSRIMSNLMSIFFDGNLMCRLMSKLRYHLRFSFEPTGYSLIHKVLSPLSSTLMISQAITDVMRSPHHQKVTSNRSLSTISPIPLLLSPPPLSSHRDSSRATTSSHSNPRRNRHRNQVFLIGNSSLPSPSFSPS